MTGSLLLPLLLVLASYFVGATPTSYWVGRGFRGVDLRTRGSGNLGATNVFRVLGWRWALPVVVVDILKGWAPVALFPLLLASGAMAGEAGVVGSAGRAGGAGGIEAWAIAFGAAAIVGHMYSFWVGFRGGKGVATSAGVFLGLAPWAVLAAFAVWGVVVVLTRYVSLGSVLAALVLPVAVVSLPHRGGAMLPAFASALALFVIWAHRANVKRLMRGEESRIGRRA